MSRAAVNPFATRFTRPGVVEPLDATGAPLDLAALIAEARRLGAAVIEGPHGSGKTNLLTALAGRLASDGMSAGIVRVRSRADLAAAWRLVWTARPGQVACIDSWEQLGLPGGMLVRAAAAVRGVTIVTTSHAATGMPRLIWCRTSPALLAAVVGRLPDHAGRIAPADLADSFARHAGNLRDSLANLYDRFERRR